jgi:serine/threonine protein kinase
MTGSLTPDDPIRSALERAIGFQYEIIRLLGRGGMGAVYHAHERALDRPVAIKVLPPDVALTADGRERFLREARTAARLTHPNIVPLLTFGETHGLVYYVMGYVEGESLEQRLRRGGKLDPQHAARILEQLAGALDYAHQQGVVHRDVKPDNVLLERGTGVAKLTDFGIAKRAAAGETLTGTGLLLGTPRYMSPEQASGDRDLDARSDVYSLGLVGYAMLTGRPPFDGSSVQEILTQQVTRAAPSLRKLDPDLPSSIVVTIERALRKNPGDRVQSAGAFAESLREEDEGGNLLLFSKARRPGVYAIGNVLMTIAILDVSWWMGMSTRSETVVLSALMLLALPVGILSDYAVARWREKRSSAEIVRIFTEPPRWWSFWWPASFRRRDDLWSRLPSSVRLTRIWGSIGIGLFALGLELTFLGITGSGLFKVWKHVVTPFMLSMLGTYVASLGALIASAVRPYLWAKRNGVSFEDSTRIHSEPTAKPQFWSKPHIAKFLSPPLDVRDAEPQTPQQIADAVAVAVRQLPAPQRDSVSDAPNAARQLVAAIDALDGEIAILARDADPTELGRLESRLAALGSGSASDSPGQRDMRQLYASQLELLRRLSRQSQELATRRARYVELLRTLWLQVCALRAQHAADDARVDDLSGRIRHLLLSVRREVEGSQEANRVLAPLDRA